MLFTIRVEPIRVDHYHHDMATSPILAALSDLKESIMSEQSQVTDALNAAGDKLESATNQLGKIATEVQGLKDALSQAAGSLEPGLKAAIERVIGASDGVAAGTQAVDDMNEDQAA